MDNVSISRLKNIADICRNYKDGKYSTEKNRQMVEKSEDDPYRIQSYDILEFQCRLGSALLPEPETGIHKKLDYILRKADNGLEEAIFYSGPETAHEVADELIIAINSLIDK